MLIGFTGKAGCGKGYAAQRLIKYHGYTLLKLSDPLKNMLRTLGLTDDHIEGSLKDVPCNLLCGQTPRFAMQTLGTEWGRMTMGREFWTEQWCNAMVKLIEAGHDKIVCDDVRFANESQLIHEYGGYVVRVKSAVVSRELHDAATHASENDLVACQHVVFNDFSPSFGSVIDHLTDYLRNN